MSHPELTLEMFAEHIRYTNPFDENRVTQTDSLSNDVPEIHARAFEDLRIHAERAARSKVMGRGVVVTGPPGVGKSHLLARFGEWAREEKYPFIYIRNLQAGPSDILRSILRASISILTKGFLKAPGETRLFRLVSAAINQSLLLRGMTAPVDMRNARRAFRSDVNDLNWHGPIYTVLWLFFADIYGQTIRKPPDGRAELAIRWLSGAPLDTNETKRLELNASSDSEDGCVLNDEQMKEVLKILCQFAGFRERSFILCFDQVDSLSEDQVESWASVTAQGLLDGCPNLLVVTSGVDLTFAKWMNRNLVSLADWERIHQFSVGLGGIRAEIALTMILVRLRTSLDPYASLPEIATKRKDDELFPIGEGWGKRMMLEEGGALKNDQRPRDVINKAGAAWDQECRSLHQQGVANWLKTWTSSIRGIPAPVANDPGSINSLVDQKIEAKLAEHRQARLLCPEELPVDAGNLVGLLKKILAACENAPDPHRTEKYGRLGGVTSERMGTRKPAFQMIVEHRPESSGNGVSRKMGVVVADAYSGNAATNMLKRIRDQLNGPNPPDEAILVVDGRDELRLAKTGKGILDDLKSLKGRFTIETLNFEQYAMLDALQGVIGLADSEDLEAVLPDGSGRPIIETEVYDSHHRLGRFLVPPLLCRLVGKDVVPPSPPLGECIAIDRQKILETTYAQLALDLGLTTEQLTHRWIERQQPRPPERCRAQVHAVFKEVVLQLHDEGKVKLTPINDHYMVLPMKQLMGAAP